MSEFREDTQKTAKQTLDEPVESSKRSSRKLQLRRNLASLPLEEQGNAIRPAEPGSEPVQALGALELVQMCQEMTKSLQDGSYATTIQQKTDLSTDGSSSAETNQKEAPVVQLTPGGGGSGGGAAPVTPPIDMASVVSSVKSWCTSDRIATQKLADVDAEKYYQGTNPKTAFYTAVGRYINANPTTSKTTIYNACFNNCASPYKNKGKPVPTSKLSPHLFRTNGFSTYFDYQVSAAHRTALLARATMRAPTGQAAKDEAMKLLRADIKAGATVESFMASGTMLTPTGRAGWYSTDEVKFTSSSDTNFDGILELNALQPEYFADGTVSYKIKKSAFLSGASNNLRKPTCYDGMQSSLWMARNLRDNAFGVTGGGASEFLASNIPMSAVEEYTASLPSEDMVVALKTLQRAAQAHLLSTDAALKARYDTAKAKLDTLAPTDPGYNNAVRDLDKATWELPNLVDEVIRGNDVDLRAVMTAKVGEVMTLVDQIIARTEQERSTPSNRSSRPTHDLSTR